MSSRPSSKPEAPTDQAACTRQALDLLARREHTRLELERKLLARGFREDIAAAALDGLEQSGALAEARFTESFVRVRAARGQGPKRIRMELLERGVDAQEAAAALTAGGLDWHELAGRARAKRFGPALPKDYKERARQTRFLQYRGFQAAQIESALRFGET
jgi:regulatory protein